MAHNAQAQKYFRCCTFRMTHDTSSPLLGFFPPYKIHRHLVCLALQSTAQADDISQNKNVRYHPEMGLLQRLEKALLITE